ncbi:uncharacterized protein [Cherax quadricarinatus]
MKVLVILVAAACCSAQLVLPYAAPWVLPSAKVEGDAKPIALPYSFALSSGYPFFSPYSSFFPNPLAYAVPADATLKPTEFPYVFEKVAAKTAVEKTRRRRDVSVPLPQVYALPSVAKTTVETKQFETVDAATPADTKKIELTTKEREITVPTLKYVQPVVNLKPVTYSAASPALPYALPYALPHASLPYAALPYAALPNAPLTYAAPYAAYSLGNIPVVKFKE